MPRIPLLSDIVIMKSFGFINFRIFVWNVKRICYRVLCGTARGKVERWTVSGSRASLEHTQCWLSAAIAPPFLVSTQHETAGHSRCLDQHKHYRVLVLLPEQIPRAAAGWSTLMNLAGTVVCMNFAVWLTVWLNTKILSGTQTRSSSKKMWSNQAPAKGAFKIYMTWVTIEQMS